MNEWVIKVGGENFIKMLLRLEFIVESEYFVFSSVEYCDSSTIIKKPFKIHHDNMTQYWSPVCVTNLNPTHSEILYHFLF